MSKRPPEMVLLSTIDNGDYLAVDYHIQIVRSLRVKLFRERAENHSATAEYYHILSRYSYEALENKKAQRFARIADAIERGEK